MGSYSYCHACDVGQEAPKLSEFRYGMTPLCHLCSAERILSDTFRDLVIEAVEDLEERLETLERKASE